MQRALPEWTGVQEGYESFLHSGDTTYIATGQYPRFASAYLRLLQRERAPLRSFTQRFATLIKEVTSFHATLAEFRHHDEKIASYLHLHQQMQPYSYVFGYGEDQIVGELLQQLLREAGLLPAAIAKATQAATAPLTDADATGYLGRLRVEGHDARTLDFADLVREQVQVRTDRRVLWNKVEQSMRPYLARRAEKANLAVKVLLEATPQELVQALPPRNVLEARAQATFLAHDATTYLLTGEDHARVQRGLGTTDAAPDLPLVGRSAYPGVVIGRVRIVLTNEDGDALQKGEILVSDMTTPELTTACGRAAAIVTDRGGILCHAALVAREMKIPTILGTENATRVLRTGDLVEVDATRGFVRKLSESR